MRQTVVTLYAIVVVLCAPAITAAFSASPVTELRVEWEQVPHRSGVKVRGYVVNQHQMRAENVRLRVEQLDAEARPIVTRTVWVIGTIPYRDRGYFEVVVPASTGYRVSIETYDRAGCGDG